MSACSSPAPGTGTSIIDLTTLVNNGETGRLDRLMLSSSIVNAVEAMTLEAHPRKRIPRFAEVFRKLDTVEAAEVLKAGAQMALRQETPGLRLLFGFLEVKRPGAEVLRQISKLCSVNRVAHRTVAGTWVEPDESRDENAVFQILEVLDEATRLGVIDLMLGREKLPRTPIALGALVRHIRLWFGAMTDRLEAGGTIDDDAMNLVAQLSMLEISLTERRVSRLAATIDPYDARGIGRLMPVMSYYDQDIEHLKNVVSRLSSYRPFYERLLTMENALSSSEVDKIQKKLAKDPLCGPVSRILGSMRTNPILDWHFAFLVSLIHQVGLLRALAIGSADRPLVLDSMIRVTECAGMDGALVTCEPEILEQIGPAVDEWGIGERTPEGFRVRLDPNHGAGFVLSDGTPFLPDAPEGRRSGDLSLKELVRMQIDNDPFILGVLDNPRALSQPGIVPLVAMISRSLRVLDKLIITRTLHTGPANKDVPLILMQNPTRVPITSLKSLLNVRHISRVDLERLARSSSDVRPEVRQEARTCLRRLRS